MYKVKRFSSNNELEALVNRVAEDNVFYAKASKSIKVPTNQGLFGSSSSSSSKSPSRSVLNSSVRNIWRLQSYLRSVTKNDIVGMINTLEVGVAQNKAVKASDYVTFSDRRIDDEWNVSIINAATNPLVVFTYHESWLSLVESMMNYSSYDVDYHSLPFKTNDGSIYIRTAMTIDDLDLFISMFTYFNYLRKVYGNQSSKLVFYFNNN